MWDHTMLGRAGKIVVSKRVVLEEGMVSAAIVIAPDGTISNILKGSDLQQLPKDEKVLDFGDLVVLPGLVDSHVHVNEPGRTEWEGFWTATQAAAAGGVTTIVDMPLNSIPPTTTVDNLEKKLAAAEGKLHVDVGFWGGLIPSNLNELLPLVRAGVVGFKCFLCPSGVDEFPHVSEADVRKALTTLRGADLLLAFHAELEQPLKECSSARDCSEYATFLETRPPKMETTAVDMVCRLSTEYKSVRCHIVHASACNVVKQAQQARAEGALLTVETCHHYLTLNAEAVPRGGTMFKCCPPIRDKVNQDELWQHVQNGDISLIVSDHSPCPPAMKGESDFLSAWGGISSLQFGLTVLWTAAAPRGVSLLTLSRLTSSGPAELCHLPHKGSLALGKDADLVVFDPDAVVLLGPKDVLHRHKLSPHLGRDLRGKVLLTMLRGNVVFRAGETLPKPQGRVTLLKK